MTSPEKREANRQNARKSTGPKTPEGKARSSRNATTHGLTAQPGEPTEAYRAMLAEWIGDLKSKGIAERTLAERACRAAWNLRRCDRYEDATAFKRNRDAAESHELAEAARAEAIGRRLIAWPAEADEDGGDAQPEYIDPAGLVAELRRTSAGVSWLLARWAELDRALKGPAGWGEAGGFVAARLLGLSAEAAGVHPALGRLRPRAGGAKPDMIPPAWVAEAVLALALEDAGVPPDSFGGPNRTVAVPLDRVREYALRGRGEAGSADAKRLGALVRSERAKLARLMRKVLKGHAAEDRAGAADRALFDESKSLSLCLRYATAASRDLHRSIRDLAMLREAGDGGDGDEGPTSPRDPGDGDAPGPGSGGPGSGGDWPSRGAAKLRNEATDALSAPASSGPGAPPRPDDDGAPGPGAAGRKAGGNSPSRVAAKLRNEATEAPPAPASAGRPPG